MSDSDIKQLLPPKDFPKTEVYFRLPIQDSSSFKDEGSSDEENVDRSIPQPMSTSKETGTTAKDWSSEDDVALIPFKTKEKRLSNGEVASKSTPQTSSVGR
jgi:hypothetical protein